MAEERYFYSPLIDSDQMQEDARHGMAEHHEIDDLIEKLDETNFDSPGWLAHMKTLAEKVDHHLDDEEKEFFDKVKKLYSDDEAEALAKGYRDTVVAYKKEWPASVPGE